MKMNIDIGIKEEERVEVAERIRSLGGIAPGSYKTFTNLSSITEVEEIPNANNMLRTLTLGHEQLVKTCRTASKLARNADNGSSASLVSDRMREHEKTAWMLRSILSA